MTDNHSTKPQHGAPDRRFVIGALAALAALPCLPQAVLAQTGPGDLVAARRKLNAYADLYRATHRLQASWERYLGQVDAENGPTGRETRLLGVTAPDAATAELAAAEKAVANPPFEGEADRAAKALIQFYREAAPLMSEAAAFYPTYSPKDDQGRAGQVWHRRMKSVMTFTIDNRKDLYKAADAMRGDIEIRELAAFGRKGKGAEWHVRASTVAARVVRDVFPLTAGDFDPEQLTARLAAFQAHVELCAQFEQANPGKLMMFSGQPQSFARTMSKLQAQIAARPEPRAATIRDIMTALTAYGQLTEMADLYFLNIA